MRKSRKNPKPGIILRILTLKMWLIERKVLTQKDLKHG